MYLIRLNTYIELQPSLKPMALKKCAGVISITMEGSCRLLDFIFLFIIHGTHLRPYRSSSLVCLTFQVSILDNFLPV